MKMGTFMARSLVRHFAAAVALAFGSPAFAQPITLQIVPSGPSQLSTTLGNFAGSVPVIPSGSITIEWDRVLSRARVIGANIEVRSVGGASPSVPVSISVFGPLAVGHSPITISLHAGPTAWQAVAFDGSWASGQISMRMDTQVVYAAEVAQCAQLITLSVPCQRNSSLAQIDSTSASVSSATLSENSGVVSLDGCLQVRVPFDAGSPGISWSVLTACFQAEASPAACRADFNNDGAADLLDLLGFLNDWLGLLGQPAMGSAADFIVDGTVDLLDLLDYLAAWIEGCAG